MKYAYKVRNAGGKVFTGTLEADHKNTVIESLLNQGYHIVALNEVQESKYNFNFDISLQKVPVRDLVVMTRQLATMLSAGLSIIRCLNILAEQTNNKKLNKALVHIRNDIEEGSSLWQALSKHKNIFSPVYISMIKAGELGGILELVLDRLGTHLEREQEINSKVKSASIYPAIISVFAILVVVFIISFVMPTFIGMFQAAGADLPIPTQILLDTGLFIKGKWWLLLLALLLIIFVFKLVNKTAQGRLLIDSIILKIPVIGKAISKIIVARFARTMGTLLRSGIPVLQALEVVEDVVGNEVVAKALRDARTSISEGDTITVPLKNARVFEPMVTHMIAVGEETGALDDMLIRMSDYFEKEVAYAIDSIMSILEPLLILVVALLVGGVVIATLLPVFEIMNSVNGF